MRSHVHINRLPRRHTKVRRSAHFDMLPRSLVRGNTAIRTERASEPSSPTPLYQFQLNPYLDYGRFLTAGGGILIIYKDLDLRWRHTAWRLVGWASFMGLEAYYLVNFAALDQWLAIATLLALAIMNWLIVAKPVELYRKIEFRPDCMIIDDNDVFWARYIEGGIPACRRDPEGNHIFSGFYGTRFVEYLTIRRFDENDRTPEVMSAHLRDAMRQLWMMPY